MPFSDSNSYWFKHSVRAMRHIHTSTPTGIPSLVPIAGIGPATSPLPRECSTTEPNGQKGKPGFPSKILSASSMKMERGRRIELLALAWKAKVLPLYEPRSKSWHWWRGLDSNQRTRKRADLQSAAINHSATSPIVSRRLCHFSVYGR